MEGHMKEKKIKTIFRKVIISVLLLTITLTIPGCGDDLKRFVSTDLTSEAAARIDANLVILRQLADSGLINEESFTNIKEQLEKVKDDFMALGEGDGNQDTFNTLISAVSNMRYFSDTVEGGTVPGLYYVPDGTGNNISVEGSGKSAGELADFLIGNYVAESIGGGMDHPGTWVYSESPRENVNAIQLISDDMADYINGLFGFNVYVLNPTATDGKSIDEIVQLFQDNVQTVEGASGTVKQNLISNEFLNTYFVPAVDANGNKVTLLDTTQPENMLVQESKANTDRSANRPGMDMVLSQNGAEQLSIRFNEFNQDVYDKIVSMLGINNSKFAFSANSGDNNIYLLEYPAYYVSEFSDNGDNTVTANLERSGIGVNLLTGKIVKYEGSEGSWSNDSTPLPDTIDSYLTMSGAENEEELGMASFIVKGVCEMPINVNVEGATQSQAYSGRIVLRDYLEGVYSPGVSTDSGTNIAVYGRKIRLDMDDETNWVEDDSLQLTVSGDVTNDGKSYTWQQYKLVFKKGVPIANFIDKEGNDLTGETLATDKQMPQLQITDFADFSLLSGSGSESQVKTLNLKNMDGASVSESDVDSVPGENKKIGELTHKTGSSVEATGMFPGPTLGVNDYNSDSDSKQRFYVLATDTDMFDTSLFSAWINSSDEEASLDAWNNYLAENDMMYNIDHNAVNDYLMSNYQYELSQNGVVILDLETVAKIQDELDQKHQYSRNRFVTTSIIVIGWILIGYALLLLLAWVLDTNADIGIKLTEKLTLGHWVAIKYKDDVPNYDASERKYLTLGSMIIRCSVVIVTGILLLRIDVFEIVLFLINMFGDVAIRIEEIIRGI